MLTSNVHGPSFLVELDFLESVGVNNVDDSHTLALVLASFVLILAYSNKC
jgi:hypothetical protein